VTLNPTASTKGEKIMAKKKIEKIEVLPEYEEGVIVGAWYEEIREIQLKINKIIKRLNE
jgi:hypothetical protein